MSRFDMRNENEPRPLTYELGLITEACGSCKLNCGNTSAISRIYGPHQPKYSRHENIEKGTLEVELSLAGYSNTVEDIKTNASNVSYSTQLNTKIENRMVEYIKQVLENVIFLSKFPKLIIVVQITLLNDDGSSLPLCLNSCILALLDACIPLHGIPLSLQLSKLKSFDPRDNKTQVSTSSGFIVDPSKDEELHATSNFIYTFLYKKSYSCDQGNNKQSPVNEFCLLASDCRGLYSLDDLNNTTVKASELVVPMYNIFLEIMKTK